MYGIYAYIDFDWSKVVNGNGSILDNVTFFHYNPNYTQAGGAWQP